MNSIEAALGELIDVNQKYGLSDTGILEYLDEMDKMKIPVPVIGSFSSGKSSVLNTLLAYSAAGKLLLEDVTPETAVPTEIYYTDDPDIIDTVLVHSDTKGESVCGIEEYRKSVRGLLDAKNTSKIEIRLGNSFLRDVSRIKLVDMPGFGSGDDLHDRAINDYAANAIAYIITFPADDLILRDDIGSILKELVALDKCVSVMITKTDKAPSDSAFKEMWINLELNLRKYLGERRFEPIETSSKDGEVEEFKECLLKLQEESENLLYSHRFFPFFKGEVEKTLAYLRERIQKNKLSESELKEREERLHTDMERLVAEAKRHAEQFRADTAQCVEDIVSDVRSALNQSTDTYVAMAMNRSDEASLGERINTDVRTVMNSSAQKQFFSKAEKYAKNISAELGSSEWFSGGFLGLDGGSASATGGFLTGGLGGAALGGIISSTGILGGSIGILGITIPIAAPVLAALGLVGGILGMILGGEKKRTEQREKIRRALVSEVYPSILSRIRPAIEQTLSEATTKICTEVEHGIHEHKETLEKAIEDNRRAQEKEASEKALLSDDIHNDIEKLEGLCDAARPDIKSV